MKQFRIFFAITLLVLFAVLPVLHAEETKEVDAYRIGCGDVLHVSVWQNEKLNRDIIVQPDGRISLPLAGELMAAGKSLAELQNELSGLFKEYINDPVLTISLRATNSMYVYVIGKVNMPGRHAMAKRLDVMQILATAGGLNAFASEGNIRIQRREPDCTRIFHFNYRDVSRGKHLEQNILLERGDVIIVP